MEDVQRRVRRDMCHPSSCAPQDGSNPMRHYSLPWVYINALPSSRTNLPRKAFVAHTTPPHPMMNLGSRVELTYAAFNAHNSLADRLRLSSLH